VVSIDDVVFTVNPRDKNRVKLRAFGRSQRAAQVGHVPGAALLCCISLRVTEHTHTPWLQRFVDVYVAKRQRLHLGLL
jgi:hypothetical protein